MPVIVLGGILGGAFTPTEAAVVAALYAFVLGTCVYKELRFGTSRPSPRRSLSARPASC